MKKEEEKQEAAKAIDYSKLSAESIELIIEQQDKALQEAKEKKDNVIEKIFNYEFKTGAFNGLQTALTRKEKKALKKKKFDIGNYNIFEGDDDTIDAILELRGVKDVDDILDYEIHFWVTKVILRTVRPYDFEGND